MTSRIHYLIPLVLLIGSATAHGQSQFNFRPQEIENELGVGYAVSLVDVNGDKKLDIVVVDTNRVLWYENPTWKRRVIIEGQTKPDNVCIAALRHRRRRPGRFRARAPIGGRPTRSTAARSNGSPRRKSLDDKWTVYPDRHGADGPPHALRRFRRRRASRADRVAAAWAAATRGPNFDGGRRAHAARTRSRRTRRSRTTGRRR